MKKRVYLDYAASTPVDKEVLKAMHPFFKKEWGNPSSLHSSGQKARSAIEQAREKIAKFLNCKPFEVVFTSGATEANNLAIWGIVESRQATAKDQKLHIVTSQIEHESVLAHIQDLEARGFVSATYIAPDKEGIINSADVEKAIRPNTILVSIMYANSEIGTVQPIAEIGALLKGLKTVFHTDAVQAAQFLDCDVKKLGVDLLTLSSHKIYGPKGVGALYIKEGIGILPLVLGGGQEQGMRSGTENVAGIAGMGKAIEEVSDPKSEIRNIKMRQLRDMLIKEVLRRVHKSSLTGSRTQRLANNAHFRFQKVHGKDLAMLLDQKGFAVSTGSSCSEKTEEPSHVLLALGLSVEDSLSSLRVTLGKQTTKEEIAKFIKTLVGAVEKLRQGSV